MACFSLTLGCATTDSPGSTAMELVDDFMKVINEYMIQHDLISAIVTDTEPTMNAFGRRMNDTFNIAWIGCIDHILELSTGKAFDDSKYPENLGCMKAARKLVGTFRHSNQKMDQLKQYQITEIENLELNVDERKPVPIIPIEDCSTRWWSTYSMLDRLYSLKKHIGIMEAVGSIDNNLSEAQWNVVAEIVKLLKPFMVVQEWFEGEHYVTVSSVCILIENIRKKLNDLKVSINNEAAAIVVEVIKSFQEAWGKGLDPANEHKTRGARQRVKGFQPAHLCAAFLDPRSKSMTYFDEATKIQIQLMIKHEAEAMSQNMKDSPPVAVTKVYRSASSIDEMLNEEEEVEAAVSTTSVENEIHKYLSMKKLAYYQTTSDGGRRMNNPLDWWRINQPEFPILSKLAKKYLCIPATSAPVERLFSRAGLTITEKRNRLAEDVAADLIFLNANWDKLDFSMEKLLKGKDNIQDEMTVINLE